MYGLYVNLMSDILNLLFALQFILVSYSACVQSVVLSGLFYLLFGLSFVPIDLSFWSCCSYNRSVLLCICSVLVVSIGLSLSNG